MSSVAASAGDADVGSRRALILVIGASGEPEYGQAFGEWATRWREAAERGGVAVTTIGGSADEGDTDLKRLETAVASAADADLHELWVVLIGHGTFDGQAARFNLAGPDLEANELARMLRPVDCPTAVVNCASASAPFVNALSAPGRVVLTATKSGTEDDATRFGGHLSAAVAGGSDLDKDGQTSLLEAAVAATRETAAEYVADKRLATEHALIDDNGDHRGTRLDLFEGVRLNPAEIRDGTPDGRSAHDFVLVPATGVPLLTADEKAERQRLEAELERLRAGRPDPVTDEYFESLEAVLLPLSRMYEAAEQREAARVPDEDEE